MVLKFILASLPVVLLFYGIFAKRGKKSDTSSQTHTQSPKSHEQIMAETYRLLQIGEALRQAKEHGNVATQQAIKGMYYQGKLPMQKPDGTWTNIYSTILSYSVAGINYAKNIQSYLGLFDGYLQPEPTNKYDPNAIAVYHSIGHHLGYISKAETADIRDLHIAFPIPIWGEITQESDDTHTYYVAIISLELPPKVSPSNL